MSPALRYTLLSLVEGEATFGQNKGKLLEDIVALYLYREFGQKLTSPIFYDAAKKGADFIIQLRDKKVVLEVGYGNKGVKQAEHTLDRANGNYGLVISDSGLIKHGNVIKVPLQYFLLC